MTFQAQGQIYHDLPNLVPTYDTPLYFQLYSYDRVNELQNRRNTYPYIQLWETMITRLTKRL